MPSNVTIELSHNEREKLKASEVAALELKVLGRSYFLNRYIAEGRKSVVWIGKDGFNGVPVAIKFATKRDYDEHVYLAEVNKAAPLHQYPQFTQYLGAEEQTINGVECVVFIEEYVEGKTLRDFDQVTPSFVESYIQQFCIILSILKAKNIRHDDLNLGNVMIVPPLPGDYRNEYTIKIIDMGSLKNYGDPLKPSKLGLNDLKRFCIHLKHLSNKIILDSQMHRRPLSKKEKLYRGVIKKILPLMLEEDENISLNDPEKIKDVFMNEFANCMRTSDETSRSIDSPFDYISADHIASDMLLNKLFAPSCPWLKDVRNNMPILLTGPRGCGKSMIFRWLSFKSILSKGDIENIKSSAIICFYVSCSADLRNKLSLYDTPTKTAQAKEEIIHYFNLLLTREIVFTLSMMTKFENSNELFGLNPYVENEVYTYLINALSLEKSKTFLQGSRPFDHMYDIIIREMTDCYRHMLKRSKTLNPSSLTYLSDLSAFLNKKIDFFKNRTLTFLLDDYSLHRISEPVQIILNNILWERQSNHIFKVSSEKFGMVTLQDLTSSSYSATTDLSREFVEIDVGERYVNLSSIDGTLNELIGFCTELLNHRLLLAKYSGTTQQIIGKSEYGVYKTLENALRFQTHKEKRDYDEYHGIETISKICSGDISALLEMYRRIFKEGGVTKETISTVSKAKQNRAIQSTSRAFFDIIKTFNFGQDMYDLVNHFGNFSRKILQEGKLQADKTPQVSTRIEVDELEDMSKWKTEQKELFMELIHRSIFISLEPGRGRRTLGSTMRIQLRRIYCPHFKTGLTKTFPIKLTMPEFRYFLSDPKSFCENEFAKKYSTGRTDNNMPTFKFGDDDNT